MADNRPGDRHNSKPKAVRMPGGLEAWYKRHAGETGRHVNAVLVEALEEYRLRHEPATASIGGVEIGITVEPRQPPGIVSVIAPAGKVTQVRSFALAPEEPAPEPQNCNHPNVHVKGTCPDCFEPVGYK